MASGRIRRKQETTRTQMELTKIGMRGKTNDPLSQHLPSSSFQGELNLMDTCQEDMAEHSSHVHEYEEIKRYSPGFNIPHKNYKTIYPKHSKDDPHQKGNQNIKSTECWRDSNNKDSLATKLTVGFILVVSLTSLVLVFLDVVGVIGPKCVCNSNFRSARQYQENFRPNASTSSLLKRIDMLEKNISSLVIQLKSKYGGNEGNGSKKENSSSTSSITKEVQKLRKNQVQLDSSLKKLKESDKTRATNIQDMKDKVVGLAVVVDFLAANDSLIKSKVHNLNSSVSQLKFVDGQIKIKLDQLNTEFMSKISSINSTVNTMQGGGAGPPGPPGPQGPRGIPGTPGAGNLSQCQHQQKKAEGTIGANSDFYLTFAELKDQIVVGATCSTVGGDETYLSSYTISGGEKEYMCTCKGRSNFPRSGNSKCFIDVWVCPRIS